MFVGISVAFAGFSAAFEGVYRIGLNIAGVGVLLLIPLFLERVFLVPRLTCPRCGNPFFAYKGFLGSVAQNSLLNRSCLNCGLGIYGTNTDGNANG